MADWPDGTGAVRGDRLWPRVRAEHGVSGRDTTGGGGDRHTRWAAFPLCRSLLRPVRRDAGLQTQRFPGLARDGGSAGYGSVLSGTKFLFMLFCEPTMLSKFAIAALCVSLSACAIDYSK